MHNKYFLLAEVVVDEHPSVSTWDLILKASFEAEQLDRAVHDPSPEELELIDSEEHSYSAGTHLLAPIVSATANISFDIAVLWNDYDNQMTADVILTHCGLVTSYGHILKSVSVEVNKLHHIR